MSPRKAYSAVKQALVTGRLKRPESCQRCGVVPGPASDGRSKIQAHHHDYSKPLDVEWICAKCHRKETPMPSVVGGPNYGEKNGYSKLTTTDVISARRLRQKGLTYKAIADRFRVHKTTIIKAVKGTLWAHVKDDLSAAPTPDQK